MMTQDSIYKAKTFADYEGRVYGPELVSLGKAVEPEFPQDATDEKAKAIWNTKKSAPEEVAMKDKACEQCDEPMTNQIVCPSIGESLCKGVCCTISYFG